MVAASTLAVSTLAALGPSQVTVVAYAASPAAAINGVTPCTVGNFGSAPFLL